MNGLDSFLSSYIRALDDRRFDDWLSLFSDDGVYAVIRNADDCAGNHLFLLREGKEKLRNRIETGARTDRDMRIHLTAGIQGSERDGAIRASANFMLLKNGAVTYSGQYRLDLRRVEDRLSISECTAIVNDSGLDLLYLPI